MNRDNTDCDNIEQLEVHAKSIIALLDARAQHLHMHTLQQLEQSRVHAVAVHQKRNTSIVNAEGGVLSRWMDWVEHHRIVFTGLVLVTIVSSVVVFDVVSMNETSDALLLSADLPPEAFVDQGFEPSLNEYANLSIN